MAEYLPGEFDKVDDTLPQRVQFNVPYAPANDHLAAESLSSQELYDKFRSVIAGFERYFPGQAVPRHLVADLEDALHDLIACSRCDGTGCKAMIHRSRMDGKGEKEPRYAYGTHYEDKDGSRRQRKGRWFGLSHEISKFYDRPKFTFYPCSNPVERRGQVIALFQRVRAFQRSAAHETRAVGGSS